MAEYEISHPRIPQINGTILEGPEGLPPPSEADLWSAIKQKVRPLGLSNLTDEEKIIAYRNGVFDPPEIPDDSDQPGVIEGLMDLGGKAVLRSGQMLNFVTGSKIGFSGPYDKIMRLEEEAVPYEKVENVDQFRDAGKRLFGLLDNKEDLADLGDPIGDALRQAGMPFFANNPNARGRVKTAAMDYAQSSLVAGMGEGYVRAASGGEFLYKGGKYLKDKVLLDESDDQDVLDFVNSAIQFDSLNHRYENSAELAAFVLENPQESFKALASGLVGGVTNDLLIDQEDINLDSNLQQDIRSGYIEPDVGVSFLSEVIGDPMNLAGAGTAKAVTAPQRVALSGKIADTVNSTLALNKSKSTALRAIDKFGENSMVGQRQAKVLEQTNRMLAENQKLLQKYGRDSLLLRLSAQSSPAELLRVAGQNLDTASDAGKASMNMVYNALKPSGKTSLVRQGAAMGARFAPEIAGATVGASLMGPEGAAVGAAIPSLIKGLKILSTVPENVAISYIMRGAAEAGEDITEQAARKAWRSTTNKLLYPAGILGLGGGSLLKSDQEGLGDTIFNIGLSAAALKFIPKLAQLSDTVVRDSRIIGPELIFARGSEASPFFNRLALLPSADEGLIAANTDRFQALTRTSSGNTILERVIDKVRPIGTGVAISVKDAVPLSERVRKGINKIPGVDVQGRAQVPFRPGLSGTNRILSNPARRTAQFLDRNPTIGRTLETLGRFGTVVTAGSTLPAAFGYVGSGGQVEGAVVGALVSAPFTSIGAGAGMFQTYKNKSDLVQRKLGDMQYYREHLNSQEKQNFDGLPIHLRMALAGASLSHPDILILPDKEGQGSWQFNPETKTSEIRYNPETGEGLIDGLLSHEIGHHIEIHGLTPIINKLYFGDPLTKEGGVYGKFDDEGKIVPNEEFNKLREFYLEKLSSDDSISSGGADQYQGERGIEIMASELFAETVRDYLKSGKKNKGNTIAEKLITAASEAMVGTPFIRDFLLKLNLPMKADGKFIEGGFFEGKLRRIPELSKLIDQYYSDTRAMRQREIQGEEITTPGSGKIDKELSIDSRKAKRPISKDDHQSSFSLEDQNNPAIRAKLNTGGIFKWRPTSDGKGAELELGPGGAPKRYTPGELKKEQRAQGDHALKVFEKNGIEIITHKDGSKSTSDITNLTPEIIDELAAGPWHPRQIQTLREISRSLREGDGERAGFLIGYFAASKGRKPKPVPFSLRQGMPYGFKLTKDGNILVLLHDVPQLEKNLRYLKSNKVPSKFRNEYNELFKGDDNQVWADFKQYRINTANGLNGELGLDPNLSKAIRKKNFLNALHGAIDQEHINLNPILSEIKNSAGFDMFNPSPRQAFGPATKTFRLDRIFDVTRSGNMNSNINLDRAKRLLMPRQSKNFDKKVALRTNEDIIKQIDILAQQKGVSRNDLLNEILRDRVTEKTPDDSGIPVDSENVPPITEKEFQNLKDQTQKKAWSKDSDQDLNWLRNEPKDKFFMPMAEAMSPEVRRAKKEGLVLRELQKRDMAMIRDASKKWKELGTESPYFQDFMNRGPEDPVFAEFKNGVWKPETLYYNGTMGADSQLSDKFSMTDSFRRGSEQWTEDSISLFVNRKDAYKKGNRTQELVPAEMATNVRFIFDANNPDHIDFLRNYQAQKSPILVERGSENLYQDSSMLSPEIRVQDDVFENAPVDLPTSREGAIEYAQDLKDAGWDGFVWNSKDGSEVLTVFNPDRVKLIKEQRREKKFFSKDRTFGSITGLFGARRPSQRGLQPSTSRDVRFMPQMELDFDGSGSDKKPVESEPQGYTFWQLTGIDKNDKNIYKKVSDVLINTGTPEMDPQTALDYAPRLGLDVKRLRQEMEKAQARYRRGDRLYLPTAYHGTPNIIQPEPGFPLGRFRTDKIGTGEGFQAQGWGLYFATKRAVGEFYRNMRKGKGWRPTAKAQNNLQKQTDARRFFSRNVDNILHRIAEESSSLRDMYFRIRDEIMELDRKRKNSKLLRAIEEEEGYIPAIFKQETQEEKDLKTALQYISDGYVDFWSTDPGYLYKVELAPKENEYLLREKPLSEQPKNVRDKLKPILADYKIDTRFAFRNEKNDIEYRESIGKDIYDELEAKTGSPQKSSQILLESGIRGIKYLDRTSREKGEGDYNYVIFDDADVKITEKLFMPTAYHGTPHTFSAEPGAPLGRFRTSAIGTGEGAQAYGHGLYFAGKKEVAEHYRKLGYDPDKMKINGRQINDEYNRFAGNPKATNLDYQIAEGIERLMMNESPQDVISYFKENDFDPRAIKYFEDAKFETYGSLYKVELAPKENEYLYWDKPLSEQPKGVREKLIKNKTLFNELESVHKKVKEAHNDRKDYDGQTQEFKDLTNKQQQIIDELGGIIHPSWTGANIYHKLTGQIPGRTLKLNQDANTNIQQAASKFLKEAGIPGIKYLDGASRSKGEGDYNYVIFDEADVQITDKLFMPAGDVMTAVNVRNELNNKFADLIVSGQKSIETRRSRSLDNLIGNRVKIVRTTGKGDEARVIGEVTIGEPIQYKTRAEFAKDYDKHLVDEDSDFAFQDGGKFGYPMINPEKYDTPYPMPKRKGIVYTKEVGGPNKLFMPTEIQEGSAGSFFRPKSSRDTSTQVRTFKSPVYLKDGSRLSGVADNPEQNPFYGFDKSGQEFSQRREYVNPQDITKSRDSDRTANQIRKELESGQKLFMPMSDMETRVAMQKFLTKKGDPFFAEKVKGGFRPQVLFHRGTIGEKIGDTLETDSGAGISRDDLRNKDIPEFAFQIEKKANDKFFTRHFGLKDEEPIYTSENLGGRFSRNIRTASGELRKTLGDDEGGLPKTTIRVITNISKVWDYANKKDTNAVLKELKKLFVTPEMYAEKFGRRNLDPVLNDEGMRQIQYGGGKTNSSWSDLQIRRRYLIKYLNDFNLFKKYNINKQKLLKDDNYLSEVERGVARIHDIIATFSGDLNGILGDKKRTGFWGSQIESGYWVNERLIPIIKGLGYDGMRNLDSDSSADIPSKSVLIFDPKSIKLVEGKGFVNYGTFDANNPDIRYMPSDSKAPTRQPANRIQQQAPLMPANRFMAPAASAGARLSERFR